MGSGCRLLGCKLSKIKALADTAALASGPAHASLSPQEGPHLTLLASHWPDIVRACTGCCQGQPALDLQEHLEVDGLPDCQPLCRGHTGLPGQVLTPQLPGLPGCCVESPVWWLRSALGTALGTVNLCLDPLCLCLLSLSTSRPLSALAEGGTCRRHPHPGLPTEPGGLTHSRRLLACQVGAEHTGLAGRG